MKDDLQMIAEVVVGGLLVVAAAWGLAAVVIVGLILLEGA